MSHDKKLFSLEKEIQGLEKSRKESDTKLTTDINQLKENRNDFYKKMMNILQDSVKK